MNYTSAQANKLLKKLNDEYTALLDKETRSRDFRAAMGRMSSPFGLSTITLKRRSVSQSWKRKSASSSTPSTFLTPRRPWTALT